MRVTIVVVSLAAQCSSVSLASREITGELTLLLVSFLSVHDFCEERVLLELINEHGNDLATAKANHGYGTHGLMEMEYDMLLLGSKRWSLRSDGAGGFSFYYYSCQKKSVMIMVDRYRKHVCVCAHAKGRYGIRGHLVLVLRKQ